VNDDSSDAPGEKSDQKGVTSIHGLDVLTNRVVFIGKLFNPLSNQFKV
jgi:hypothetical protein